MPRISASQLIFANVESNQSPAKRSGFQVLYYTHDRLNSLETKEIEARLFFQLTEGSPQKHIFFLLSSGQIALGRVVPLPEPDSFRRIGRYFGHVLVLRPQELLAIENNPFCIFDCFSFMKSVEEASSAGDFASGDIPPVTIDCELSVIDDTSQFLTRETLVQFLIVAAQSRNLKEERRPICLYNGNTPEILRVLKYLFSLLPTKLRLECSFDTNFTGGNLAMLPYWAVGFPDGLRSGQYNSISFETNQRQFITTLPPQQQESLFETWVRQFFVRDSARLKESAMGMDSIYSLSEWLEGQPNSLEQLSQLDSRTWTWAIKTPPFSFRIENQVRSQLRQQLGGDEILVENLLPAIMSWLQETDPVQGIQSLTHGICPEHLGSQLAAELAKPDCRPTAQQLAIWGDFPRRFSQPFIQLVYLRWNGLWDLLSDALSRMGEEEFCHFARWALNTMSLQVDWMGQPEQSGISLNVRIQCPPHQEQELHSLFSALLDLKKAGDSISEAPWRQTAGGMFQRQKRGERQPSSYPPFIPRSFSARRWQYIIQLLGKTDN